MKTSHWKENKEGRENQARVKGTQRNGQLCKTAKGGYKFSSEFSRGYSKERTVVCDEIQSIRKMKEKNKNAPPTAKEVQFLLGARG